MGRATTESMYSLISGFTSIEVSVWTLGANFESELALPGLENLLSFNFSLRILASSALYSNSSLLSLNQLFLSYIETILEPFEYIVIV